MKRQRRLGEELCVHHASTNALKLTGPSECSVDTLQSRLASSFQDKVVLITGHTGFKGAWLSHWLLMLGARVIGIALPPNTSPSLFNQLNLAARIDHNILNICDGEQLTEKILVSRPDYVFHLAAQPLVRLSYSEPVETWTANVIGTINILQALRTLASIYESENQVCSSVLISTDKCYENREWLHGYREDEALGGYDPYSSSKAAAELAISAWRRSYLNPANLVKVPRVGIASARAGNVVGGGDWAVDRIFADCIRHLQRNEPIPVRKPAATRPWQHVLEPLSGYLLLAALQYRALINDCGEELVIYASAYNFGPNLVSNRSVKDLTEEIVRHWPGRWVDRSDTRGPHEAERLNLSWEKAFHRLGWQPRWDFGTTIARTVTWYRQQWAGDVDAASLTTEDILAYADRID